MGHVNHSLWNCCCCMLLLARNYEHSWKCLVLCSYICGKIKNALSGKLLQKVLLPGKFMLYLTVFLIFALGSISGNTVPSPFPREVFPSTIPWEEGLCWKKSCYPVSLCFFWLCSWYSLLGVYREILSLGQYFPVHSLGRRECVWKIIPFDIIPVVRNTSLQRDGYCQC